jgi:hypothetical protein
LLLFVFGLIMLLIIKFFWKENCHDNVRHHH